MVNKYIAVINEMGDTNVSACVARTLVCSRCTVCLFSFCLADAYTIYQCDTETSIYKIDSDLGWIGQFELDFFYLSQTEERHTNRQNIPTWRCVWSLVKNKFR